MQLGIIINSGGTCDAFKGLLRINKHSGHIFNQKVKISSLPFVPSVPRAAREASRLISDFAFLQSLL